MHTKNPLIKKPHADKTTAADCMPTEAKSLDILRKRAEILAKQTAPQSEFNHSIPYIHFLLGEHEHYGIDYKDTEEILHSRIITRVPFVPDFMSGVINQRGILLPILDLKKIFNIQISSNKNNKNNYIIVVNAQGIRMGVLIDDIKGSNAYILSTLNDPLHSTNAVKPEYILGLHQGVTAILNIGNLLKDVEMEFSKGK